MTTPNWDESQHPRVPAGSPAGGEFTSGGGGDAVKAASDKFEWGSPEWRNAIAKEIAGKLEAQAKSKDDTQAQRLVLSLANSPDLEFLSLGKSWDGRERVMQNGLPHECHYNVAKLYKSKAIDAIVTGYAYATRGWTEHSWGFDAGRIIETTFPFDHYFGTRLSPEESKAFVKAQYAEYKSRNTRNIK